MTRQELEKLSLQDAYDLLVKCASDGTFPSEISGFCWYRKDWSINCKQRCPAGVFIPDELYHPGMEKMTIKHPYNCSRIVLPPGLTINHIRTLQIKHDTLSKKWDAGEFIKALNNLYCFATVKKTSENKAPGDNP